MTSRDEALRALEKKWREKETDFAAYRFCADELAAILSVRQEVAPVVALANALHEMGCENVETWTDAKMIEEASRIVRGASQFQTSEQEVAPVAWIDEGALDRLATSGEATIYSPEFRRPRDVPLFSCPACHAVFYEDATVTIESNQEK